jgi:hypothetical protein
VNGTVQVLQFLNISPAWDPSLAFVMGVGVLLLVLQHHCNTTVAPL